MNKISIIVPSYNSFATIGFTLDSSMSQSNKDLLKEVIVVDSSNDDRMFSLLSQYSSEKIHIIHLKGKTIPAIARNIGAERAKGEILVFLDSDVFPDTRFLAGIVKAYERGCLVGGGSIQVPDFQKNNVIALAQYYLQFNEYMKTGVIREKMFVPSCNLFCERELFKKVGEFPNIRAAEDVLFGLEVNKFEKLYFIPEIEVFHIFRTNLLAFLKNQMLLGKYVIIYRRQFYNKIWYKGLLAVALFPVFLAIKLVRISWRILKAGKIHIFRFLLSSPLFFLGLFFWSIGFIQGCFAKDENTKY